MIKIWWLSWLIQNNSKLSWNSCPNLQFHFTKRKKLLYVTFWLCKNTDILRHYPLRKTLNLHFIYSREVSDKSCNMSQVWKVPMFSHFWGMRNLLTQGHLTLVYIYICLTFITYMNFLCTGTLKIYIVDMLIVWRLHLYFVNHWYVSRFGFVNKSHCITCRICMWFGKLRYTFLRKGWLWNIPRNQGLYHVCWCPCIIRSSSAVILTL